METPTATKGCKHWRDYIIMLAGRVVDYLETRPIRCEQARSWRPRGAALSLNGAGAEQLDQSSALDSGFYAKRAPEDAINFISHHDSYQLSGRYDYLPDETSSGFFRALGTPPEQKRQDLTRGTTCRRTIDPETLTGFDRCINPTR